MRIEDLKAYEVIGKQELKDMDAVGYLVKHKKSGAKIALISNEDENKVFYIGFRTPPKDSTGVAHILEHSVLCGSKNFPVKDPFIELVKGSLNTFLNAITYPDKTIYPVASCNDKDFQNLMHVYLDAVFYPKIYENEAIFRQEGWHYELDENENLIYNGVVYNEMKGAFSDPDGVLERELESALYPDTTYACESGGDPAVIPELTYEEFKAFHSSYYHPSNSYIYLYGNMDMAEKLHFLDAEYLCHFDAISVDSEIKTQTPFAEEVRRVRPYSIGEEEDVEGKAYLAYTHTFGEDTLDRELYLAIQILEYVLCTVPGAPIKQALTDAGLGEEIESYCENNIKQPSITFVAKNAPMEREEEFKSIINGVLQRIVEEGFDKNSLLAAVNRFEFSYREADTGRTPKGLIYGIQALDSWLYDEYAPFLHLDAGDVFGVLRDNIETGYFEALVKKYWLENPHGALVVLEPVPGLSSRQEAETAEQLKEIKAQMSVADLQAVKDMMASLEAFREREDLAGDLAKIPLLTREDLKREANGFVNEERNIGGVHTLYHNLFSNGIGYLRLLFLTDNLPAEYIPYVGILSDVYLQMDTTNYTYGQLAAAINMESGGIHVSNSVYSTLEDPENYRISFDIYGKAFDDKLPKLLQLMEELILSTDFSNTKRLKELLVESKLRCEQSLLQAGHSVALHRAISYGSVKGAIGEQMNGLDYMNFLTDLCADFEARKEEVVEKLNELTRMIFRPENLLVDFTGDEGALVGLSDALGLFHRKLHTVPVETASYSPKPEVKNEGITTPGQVQYVCRAGNFRKKGLEYHGALNVLKVMLGYEYLWTNVRVKGGAYGCMCGFARGGDSYFVSYRDPKLRETVQVFEGAVDFVRNYRADDRTMLQYIIGAISEMDTPLSAKAKGDRSRVAFLTGITEEMIQRERDQVLDATPADIQAMAEYIRAFLSEECLCVVGSEQKIKSESNLFLQIENSKGR